MLFRSEDIERREVCRFAPSFDIELHADAPNEFRPASFCGKHSSQEKQIARLYRFEKVPNGSGGAGSVMPSSFNRCSALAGREPSRVTI